MAIKPIMQYNGMTRLDDKLRLPGFMRSGMWKKRMALITMNIPNTPAQAYCKIMVLSVPGDVDNRPR